MQPRFRSDYRSLVWSLVLFPCVPLLAYAKPDLLLWPVPATLYLAYCAGVLTHNHNHCPVFTSRALNRAYSAWLSIFYGFPTFSWIPTHNRNHHRYVDGPEDVTSTTRHSSENTLTNAVLYPFRSAFWQSELIRRYASHARANNPARFRQILLQYATLITAHAAFAGLAVALHGVGVGLVVYGVAFALPAASATWSMMFTNYMQHVECDVGSEHNHSRNFVDPLVNWFVFDAGYHTVHHESPGLHWSEYRALHTSLGDAIAPELNQRTILHYILSRYFSDRTPRVARTAV